MRVWLGRLVLAANVGALALVVWVLLRAQGPLGRSISEHKANARVSQMLRQEWERLASAPRVDSCAGQVRLVEFSDYSCPFCRQQHAILKRLSPCAGVAYRHYPSPAHSRAEGAALAAICADRQGRFLAMHTRLFESDTWQSTGDWASEAAAAGIPRIPEFLACLRSPGAQARLAEDREYGRRLGVAGTPTFLHRGGRVSGLLDDSALRRSAQVK